MTTKLAVIASIKNGQSQASISHDNSVLESTICGWLRYEEKLCDFVDIVNPTDWMKSKKAKTAGFHMVYEREAGQHSN